MSNYRAIKFQKITRQKFQALRARLRAEADVTVDGDSGIVSGRGLAATFSYDEPSQTITIQPTRLPFFLSEDGLESRLRSQVESIPDATS